MKNLFVVTSSFCPAEKNSIHDSYTVFNSPIFFKKKDILIFFKAEKCSFTNTKVMIFYNIKLGIYGGLFEVNKEFIKQLT